MAMSLEQLRSVILTSIFGRRLGLDNQEFLVGPKDMRTAIEDITSTAATSALPYGHTRVLTSGSSQTGSYTLQAPVPGVRKTLSLNSTSTGTMQFTATNAAFLSGSGTSEAVVSFITKGAFIELLGVTTAYWQVLSGSSIIPTNVLYTTST